MTCHTRAVKQCDRELPMYPDLGPVRVFPAQVSRPVLRHVKLAFLAVDLDPHTEVQIYNTSIRLDYKIVCKVGTVE